MVQTSKDGFYRKVAFVKIFLQLNIEFIKQNMYNKPIKGVACTYMCLQLRQYDIKSGL